MDEGHGAVAAMLEGSTGLRIPWRRGAIIRAVLFDLDGTLYYQLPLRLLMAIELLAATVASPRGAAVCWCTLAAYRRALEELRREQLSWIDGRAQLNRAAERAGLPAADLEPLVDEWMSRRPLKYLKWCSARGLPQLLSFLQRTGLPCGVLSDYPATDKLVALGVAERFSVVITSADAGALKPHTRGYIQACQRWQLAPDQVLMVGDRVDVDAVGAAAAGMSSVIIGSRYRLPAPPAHCAILPSLQRLHRVLATGA